MQEGNNKSVLPAEDSDFPDIIKIPNYADIVLGLGTTANPGIYYQCNTYNTNIYNNVEDYWHQILVNHNGAYRKPEILRQFIKYFPNSMFNPVRYRPGLNVDQFLIRFTRNEINTLFSNYLKLMMNDGLFIHLRIKLNVAKAIPEHIEPLSTIKMVLERQMKRCERIGEHKILNLNGFVDKTRDIFIQLSNEPSLQMVCHCIAENPMINQFVTGLKLQNNFIKTLRPLSMLQKTNITYLDLSVNDIDRIDEMFFLKPLRLSELKISKNPLSGTKMVVEKIKEILPSLTNIDGRPFKAVSQANVPIQSGDVYETANFNIGQYIKSTKWHQVIIMHEGRCKKDKILDAIFEVAQDTEFYPCYYKEDRFSDLFFVRNCLDAINSLRQTDLRLNVDGVMIPVRLIMNAKEHGASEIDPVHAISTEITERYNIIDKTLNLGSFCIKSLATNSLIINIASTKILTHILILAGRKYGSTIQHLKLSGNRIRSVKGLFPLINMKSLISIDLSDNCIDDCAELFSTVVKLKLTELNLANNPFCKTIDGPVYVREMKKKFPELEKLDGYAISENKLTYNRNYLCNLEYYDFVEKFVKNYFQIFDSQVRYQIIDFYHPKAVYSMSMNYEHTKITAADAARITKYNSLSRNILRCSDFRQYAVNLLIGNKIIVSYYSNLPVTEHDYHSFSIDVTYATDNMICITVSGIVKELGTTLLENELWLGFTRTFVLKTQNNRIGFFKGGTDFKIYNEHIHIFNLNLQQTKNGFKSKQPGDAPPAAVAAAAGVAAIKREIEPRYENECLNQIFMNITKLKMNWSVQFLTRMNWKLLPAIQYFLRLDEFNKIPDLAFQRN